MNVNSVTDWSAGLITGLTAGLARFVGAIPNIIGAIALLVIGWVIAGFVGKLITKVVPAIHVDTVADRVGVNSFLQQSGTGTVAIVILGVGAFVGQLPSGIVRGTATEARLGNAKLLAKLTAGAVMAFAIIAALNELNIAPVVVDTLYIGLVAALAPSLGLAFGLGGRGTAARLTER